MSASFCPLPTTRTSKRGAGGSTVRGRPLDNCSTAVNNLEKLCIGLQGAPDLKEADPLRRLYKQTVYLLGSRRAQLWTPVLASWRLSEY